MKSTFDILTALFEIIQPIVKDEINGKVYLYSIPNGDQNENISLNSLYNPNEYLQNGIVNVNIHLKQVRSGRPNLKRFQEIVNKILPKLEYCSHNHIYFQIDDDKGIMKDNTNDGMYWYNLRLEFQT